MVIHIFYIFSPAPVRCNDNKSDTVSTTMIPLMTAFIVVKDAVLVLRMWRKSDPIVLQQARFGLYMCSEVVFTSLF